MPNPTLISTPTPKAYIDPIKIEDDSSIWYSVFCVILAVTLMLASVATVMLIKQKNPRLSPYPQKQTKLPTSG
jgi:hypothetical protein